MVKRIPNLSHTYPTDTSQKDAAAGELLTTRQAASLLSVGERTLWRWSRSGLAPAPLKVGGSCVRFRRQDLINWIANDCQPVAN